MDHFKCYKVKDRMNPKFEPIDGVQLDDQFGNETIDVEKPFLVCNPASKNGSGIINNDLHLCCYKIKSSPLNPVAHVNTTDQFGSLDLEAKKAQMLCQPCTKTVIP